MSQVEVYAKNSEIKHLVDAGRYTRVSESRSLCGISGKSYWVPNAAYFYGANWPLCKRCEKKLADSSKLK